MLMQRKSRKNCDAIYIIGNSGVGLVVVHSDKDKKVHVLSSGWVAFPKSLPEAPRRLNSLISSTVNKLSRELGEKRSEHISGSIYLKHILFYYLPPLEEITILPLSIKNSGTSVLTEHQISEELERIEKEMITRDDRLKADRVLVERRLLGANLDGYPVTAYLQRSFRVFSSRYLGITVPASLVSRLSEFCSDHYPQASISHKSVVMSVAQEIDKSVGVNDSRLTLVMLPRNVIFISMRNGIPEMFVSDVFGSIELLNELSRTLHSSQIVAKSQLCLWHDSKLHGQAGLQIKNAIHQIGIGVREKIMELVNDFIGKRSIVKEVYVVAGNKIDAAVYREISAGISPHSKMPQISMSKSAKDIDIPASIEMPMHGLAGLLISNATIDNF